MKAILLNDNKKYIINDRFKVLKRKYVICYSVYDSDFVYFEEKNNSFYPVNDSTVLTTLFDVMKKKYLG